MSGRIQEDYRMSRWEDYKDADDYKTQEDSSHLNRGHQQGTPHQLNNNTLYIPNQRSNENYNREYYQPQLYDAESSRSVDDMNRASLNEIKELIKIIMANQAADMAEISREIDEMENGLNKRIDDLSDDYDNMIEKVKMIKDDMAARASSYDLLKEGILITRSTTVNI